MTFETIKRSAAAQEAVDQIRELVERGELQPGAKLPPERSLARQLGVSRSTLREAIRALVVMNVLVSRHGDGTYVTSLEPDLLAEPFRFLPSISDATLLHLFEVRMLVEPACAALAALRIEDRELEELERILADGAGPASPDELLGRDLELHTAIVRATHNPMLLHVMAGIGRLGLAGRQRTVALPGVAGQSAADHRRIVRALARRSPEEAAAAMKLHLQHVERAFRRWSEGQA
ncbi:MAG: FadR family transcriptional regulator [Thermoleophilia bacterium]|nr:FadR family transcriptional regulator [Thermoleophilia bacterium]